MSNDDKSNPWRSWIDNSPWYHAGVFSHTLLEMTREPHDRRGRRWAQPLSCVPDSVNVAGLYWRFVEPPPSPLTPTGVANACDALGQPLRAGEVYLSSRHGLVPVSVEGVRFLIDKEGTR